MGERVVWLVEVGTGPHYLRGFLNGVPIWTGVAQEALDFATKAEAKAVLAIRGISGCRVVQHGFADMPQKGSDGT